MARARGQKTFGAASEGGGKRTISNRVAIGGGAPRLPIRPKIEQITEEKDTSQQGNARANIASMYKPKPAPQVVEAEIQSEQIAEVIKLQPLPTPVKPLVIPAPAVLPPLVIAPTKDIGVQTPMQIKSNVNLRPDGVTEILGPGGVVLEEIGGDGKVVVDPIKDVGFDPKDPPVSIKQLREDFAEHVATGKDEAGEVFEAKPETKKLLKQDGLERFIPKVLKKVIESNTENEDGGTSGIAKEKIITTTQAQAKLKPRDYVATITEVMDSNRIRVNLSYNEGVNLYQHKGDDEVANKFKNFRVNYIKNNIERYKTYMVKDNQYYLITNEELGASGKERFIKLKQPAENCKVDDKVIFVEKRLPDYKDIVTLNPFTETENDSLFLRIPNLNSVDNPIDFQGTNYKTHDGLLSNKDDDARDIERLLISGSLLDVQPNIDYQKTTTDLSIENDDTGFGNFVNFSSAERRITNFKDKLILIESHSAASASLTTISSSADTRLDLQRKKQRVINSFDPYEHYLYFESSSYVSSSDGQFHDTAWPKSNSSSPYTLESTGDASSWYNAMVASASSYDQGNMDSLRNSLPLHINQDSENNVFLEFMDMVGQQFDEIWTYTKSITDINIRVEKLSEGISKDVAQNYARALGLNLSSGNDLVNLPEYLLGNDVDGASLYDSPQEQVTEEIWKRILANLPYFIKSKGTERALKGLLNCYGIPSSILRVREYGGPDKGTRVNYEIKRKFTRATDFRAAQYIKSHWKAAPDGQVPDTLEFRFRTPKSQDTIIVQKENDFAISLQDNGETDDYGFLRFEISGSDQVYDQFITSSLLPFYNDDFWSVMLTRKDTDGNEVADDKILSQSVYELTTKQYDSTKQRILFQSSESLQTHTSSLATDVNNITGSSLNAAFTGSGHLYIGGSGSAFGANTFTGSLMEFRVWSEPLSSSAFDNHVRAPKAYNGNSISSSYNDLLVRYQLNDNVDLSSSPTLSNAAHLQTYELGTSGSDVNGFTANFSRTLVDQEKLRVPDIGGVRRNATKIRIEDTTITQPLVYNVRKEKSSDNFAPIDSNKLGIYFAPTDVVNEDIMYSVADFDFDDYIGDPRDEFRVNYPELRSIRREYFKRYTNTNNFFDYLRILSFYDSSVFTQVKNLVPARAKASVGILIEPNILERSKQIIGDRPEFDNRYYENANHFEDGIKVTRYISGSDDNYFEVSGEYNTYNGEINLNNSTGSSLGFLNQRSLMVLDALDPRSEFGSLYATASVEGGGGTSNKIFTEVLQPNITASRTSENNQEAVFFYSSSLSASIGTTLSYSSSFINSDVQSVAYDSPLFRTFYLGTKLTRDNTIDGKEPIEVNQVSPTTIVTQDSDITKLRTD